MGSPIRAIFFDVGNTLIFPHLEALIEDLKTKGYAASVEDFEAGERAGKAKLDAWLWPQIRAGQIPIVVDPVYWMEYLRVLVERIGVPDAERESVTRRVAEGFRDIRLWSRVYPTTPPLLDRLRAQGYHLGVISNSIGTMEEQLGRLDLARRFHTILDSAVVGIEKPNRGIFELALQRARVDASEAVFVGDTYATDIGGAQLVGLRGVLMDRVGAYSQPECPHLRALTELEDVLRDM